MRIHYKYRLFLKLGLDPYEEPENVTYDYDTWSQVCQGIFVHLGQTMDKSDESIHHCGKWYITDHGRGKILQVVDFNEYEYDSDTEREIQQVSTGEATEEEQTDEEEQAEENVEEEEQNHSDNSHDADDEENISECLDDVGEVPRLIDNTPGSIEYIRREAKKCVEDIIACAIL